jgi:hypothetical protein
MVSTTPQDLARSAEQHRSQRRRAERPRPRFWHCPDCDAVMAVDVSREHACQSTTSYSPPPDYTPLDRFFLSYSSFKYDRSLPPNKSFYRLQRHRRWRNGDHESKEAWNQYQDALQEEFQLWYSAENDLDVWHALCRAIRIQPLPRTCEECAHVRNHPGCVCEIHKDNCWAS